MNQDTPVYIYRAEWNTVFTAAPEAAILHCFGNVEAFSSLFGGYVTYGRLQSDQRCLGVYGARNAARLRRLLAQSGLSLTPLHRPPPERMTVILREAKRPTRRERLDLETSLPRRR